jgi:UDP-2,3-diacylglucosamine hydrolase
MTPDIPESLGLIAGKGVYPLLLAESAHRQGVRRIVAVAFRGETASRIAQAADEVHWVHLGQLGRTLDALRASGVRQAVMAGQITPTHLFRVRMDGKTLSLLRRLKVRNAETIFGAVADELRAIGVELRPASLFMESHMPAEGLLSRRAPTDQEALDIALGFRAAKATSGLDIGQTVVVKAGTVLAVEAFEGTDATLRRAGRLGGAGAVIVKVAKTGHDMRFDIPVVGLHTMKVLKRIRASALAVEAGRAILLERGEIVRRADAMGLCLTVVRPADPEAADGAGGGLANLDGKESA